jgi:hypothetical protein
MKSRIWKNIPGSRSVGNHTVATLQEPGELSRYDYGLDGPGFDFRQGQETFLCSTVPRPALGPTHPPHTLSTRVSFTWDKAAGA